MQQSHVKKEAQTVVENKKAVSEENAKMIVNYFNSEEYQKNNKKINALGRVLNENVH